MRRKLGSVEHAFTINGHFAPLAAVSILHVQPGPEAETIRWGLDLLQRLHPFLRATLSKRGRAFFLDEQAIPESIPLIITPRLNDSHWEAVATAELNQEIGQEGSPLMRLNYLIPDDPKDPADLIFSFHHSIIDVTSGLSLQKQLLTLCQKGDDIPHKLREVLPPAEKRFPAAYKGLRVIPRILAFIGRQVGDEIRYRFQSRGTRKPPIFASASCAILTRTLDEATTAQLVQKSRRRRVTLNSLTSAAMLSAVHRHVYAEKPMPLRAIMFSNLRPYLQPTISVEDLGCMITMLRYTVPVKAGMNVWQIADVLQEKNTSAIKRGEKYLTTVFTRQIVHMTLRLKAFRLGTTAVSYAGPLPIKKQYGPIQVTGLNNFVSNNTLGPEYVAATHILFGELVWNFLYLETDMGPDMAAVIADETCSLLAEAAGAR